VIFSAWFARNFYDEKYTWKNLLVARAGLSTGLQPRKEFSMAGKFELKKSKDGQFMFNLKAANGQVILTSELYKTKPSAENGIESVRKNSAREGAFEVKTNAKGEPYFILKATNGQEVGRSEYYSSTKAMENGIESVKKNAPEAKVEDLTG
jgi:hypothetical protein